MLLSKTTVVLLFLHPFTLAVRVEKRNNLKRAGDGLIGSFTNASTSTTPSLVSSPTSSSTSSSAGLCKEGGAVGQKSYYAPHPTSCRHFVQCSDNIQTSAMLRSCPLGTFWSTETGKCDWPHRTNCTKDAGTEDFEGEDEGIEEEEGEPNEEDVGDEYDTGTEQEMRIERVKAEDAPPTLLERGSPTSTTCVEFESDVFISWRKAGLPASHPDFLPASSALECSHICKDQPLCQAWNFHQDFGCNLKQAVVSRHRYPGWKSGLRKGCQLISPLPPSHTETSCGTEQGSTCVFPFFYKGREYEGCTRAHSINGKPWCAIQVSAAEVALRWSDCQPGCPLANGGSTLGLCTNHCGSSLPQTNKRGYACYCDDSCQKYGDCCPGQQVECQDTSTLSTISTAIFGPANWVTDLVEKSEEDAVVCGNTQFYWPFVGGRPGHACGLPTPPTPELLLNVMQRLRAVTCSDPEPCFQPGCDPYLSFFRPKWYCLGAQIKQPDLRGWTSDHVFADHFLHGLNPLTVRRVQNLEELRENLILVPGVIDIFNKGDLYMADYSQLDDLPRQPNFVFYSPQVLMASSSDGLRILAILLRSSSPGVNSHLLQPSLSPPGRWLYAKMQVAVADNQLHEFAFHLPLHQMLETVVVASHNHLDVQKIERKEQHPLGITLAPHLTGTILVNWFSRHTLMRPKDSIVEQTFSVGREGAIALASANFNFSMLDFPNLMQDRGFPEGGGKLRNLFRDDGFRLWRALERYLYGVVWRIYSTDEQVMSDIRLQSWALAISNEGGLTGFPRNIHTRKLLARVLTMVIFGGSVLHHALNAPHYLYSYAPHRPTSLSRWMPDPGNPDISWDWIKEALPSLKQQETLYMTVNMLTNKLHPCTLTSMAEDGSIYPDLRSRLATDLRRISREIRGRQGGYKFLDPIDIACSIDI